MVMNKQRKPLTIKQAKLVKGVVEGKTQAQAYIDAYDTKGHLPTVEVEASKTLNKPQVKAALEEALAKHGISADAIVQVVAEGMKATKTVIIGKDEQAFADEITDHTTRLKAAGMAANFMGIGKQEGGVNINFNNYAKEQREKYDLS